MFENINIRRVLIAPLDWGLGHATRCIPIIHALLANGYEVVIAADSVILPGCVLMGRTVIGAHCIIGPHTSVDDSMIGTGCEVPHSSIKHVTIDDNSRITPYTALVGTVRP